MSEAITVHCADGTQLAATVYAPSGAVRGQIMVAGATAVPQKFYRRFADHANAQGFAVTTFDYRGIGGSAPPKLRGYRMDWLDWGRVDMAAVCASMQARCSAPLYIVGHSYGGHGFGLMPNHATVRQFYGFGVGAGWSGHMPPLERLRVNFLWHVASPVLNRLFGYAPWKLLGMGEDLPLDLANQWKRWCSFPHYYFDDPTMVDALTNYQNIRTPLTFVNASDDAWALPRSRDAFVQGYTHAPITRREVSPASVGLPTIGHMGYFRAGAEPLWDHVLARFDEDLREHSATTALQPCK
jgi:predicted alpha/beta hydrolase